MKRMGTDVDRKGYDIYASASFVSQREGPQDSGFVEDQIENYIVLSMEMYESIP